MHNLSAEAENDVIFAALDGDECHVGRRLIAHLRASILEDATDRAKDELATRAEVAA